MAVTQVKTRVEELDGLRGLLSVIVVVGHLHVWLVPWFWGCMEAFYCLSGFLIGSIIFANIGKQGFATTYFVRRALRIWPLYYVVLAFCLVFQTALTHALSLTWEPGRGVVQSLFFVQNVELLLQPGEYFTTDRPGYPVGFDHSWSVALEEQFYVLALPLCFVCRGLVLRNAILLLVALALGSLVARIQGFNWWLLPARFDAFAGGLIVALLWRHRHQVPWSGLVISKLGGLGLPVSAGLLSVLFLARGREGEEAVSVYGVSLFALFAMCLISFLLTREGQASTRLFRWRPLRFLGQISYSTYLWHLPVIWYLKICVSRIPALEEVPLSVLAIPAVFWASYASYLAIERPFLRMKESRTLVPLGPAVDGPAAVTNPNRQ